MPEIQGKLSGNDLSCKINSILQSVQQTADFKIQLPMLKELMYTHKKICEERYQYLKVQLLGEERKDRYRRMFK